MWFGKKKTLASVRTCTSHVANMIAGVTTGFRYTMRFVYAHFPINATIDNPGKNLEIRNFLGEKRVRRVEALDDTKIVRSPDVKDQLILEVRSGPVLLGRCFQEVCLRVVNVCRAPIVLLLETWNNFQT